MIKGRPPVQSSQVIFSRMPNEEFLSRLTAIIANLNFLTQIWYNDCTARVYTIIYKERGIYYARDRETGENLFDGQFVILVYANITKLNMITSELIGRHNDCHYGFVFVILLLYTWID